MITKVASDPNETREAYVARVEAAGRRVVYPAANELQIDIDNEQHLAAFDRSWAIFSRDEPGAEIADRHYSSSGMPCEHITVRLPFEVTPQERIALQAALGSDPVRELLSIMRLINRVTPATLFCEPKEVR